MEKFSIDKNCKVDNLSTHLSKQNSPSLISYDKQGNIKRFKNYIFKWDNLGRLTKCIKQHKNGVTQVTMYEYDDDGFRTKKITSQAIIEYCLFYQRISRPISTTSDLKSTKNRNICTNCTIEVEYLHNTVHLTGLMIKHDNIKTKYTFKRNYLDDIVGIFDSNNIEIVKYNYKPNGEHTTSVRVGKFFVDEYNDKLKSNPEFIANLTISKLNSYRAKSRLYDEETGLYYYNDNYYSPKLTMFLKPSNKQF